MTSLAGEVRRLKGSAGAYSLDGMTAALRSLSVRGAQTVTPALTAQTIAAGQVLTGDQTVAAVTKELLSSLDPGFTASNVKKDADLFGLIGTYEGSGGEVYAETFSFTPASTGTAVLRTGFTKKPVLIAAIDKRVTEQSMTGQSYKIVGSIAVPRYFPSGSAAQIGITLYSKSSTLSPTSSVSATADVALLADAAQGTSGHMLFLSGSTLQDAVLSAKCGTGSNGKYVFETGREYFGVILYDRRDAV